jgi:hypothetical protein
MMSEIEMTPAQETVANWQEKDLLTFVPAGEGCRYAAIIYPAGSVWGIGAVLLLEAASVHCQAAGPESMETGPTKHTIRTTEPEDGKHYLLERTDNLVKYRPLMGGKVQQYELSPRGISKIVWSNGIITEVVLP